MWPVFLLVGGAALVLVALSKGSDEPPVHDPDLQSAPTGQTRWKLVNAILPMLQQAAASSAVPMGLLVGWIAKESGGKLATKPQPGPGDTKYDERGFFQLMPDESKMLGLDHQKLSVDPVYSINGGLALIGHYSGDVDKLGVAQHGTSYYWKLVKLVHSMGYGAVQKIVDAAKTDGSAKSWEALEEYALAHNSELLSATKHSPSKWFPFVDEVYDVGAPFGFGAATTVVGGPAFPDIVDPLECLKKA